ncbi:MAG: hypothetical protein M3209_04490 [Acidobacteriota bacterium]|nr:hypothetical protein [Acidobacteriota bacterium]
MRENWRKLIDYLQILFVVLLVLGIFRLLSTDQDGGRDLVKLSLGALAIFFATDGVAGYFQRQSLKTNRRNVAAAIRNKKSLKREKRRS